MAPTLEQRLVNKALEGGDSIAAVIARGVTRDWFFNADDGDAMHYILDHHARYGAVPSPVTFASHMGTSYALFSVGEKVEYLLDQLARSQRLDVTRRVLFDAEDELKAGKVEDAMDVLRTALLEAEGYSPVPIPLVDSMDPDRAQDRLDAYYKRGASGSALLGYSTGFPTIDAATLGLQDGHLVTLVASAKSGKTTLSLTVANHIYEVHEKTVLFVTFEMSTRELELRQESLMSHVSFARLQSGRLTPAEERAYVRYVDDVKAGFDWPFWFMDGSAGSTVSAVQSLIDRHDPDVVFIDGIYMMRDEQTKEQGTAQALTNITRGLKRVALVTNKPLFISTQALLWKMKGTKLSVGSAGYSSSFIQDSDVVLGLEQVTDSSGTVVETERNLKILASRNSGLASVSVEFNLEEGLVVESGTVVV